MAKKIKVLVWNEFRHEKYEESAKNMYPKGIHGTIRDFLSNETDFEVRTATLDDPQQGISEELLKDIDVLIYWGHNYHDEVRDEAVEIISKRIIHDGMGFIPLHSSHESKIFRKLMGTTCLLKWREANEKERLWLIEPGHPIANGIPEYIEIEHEETYGERFDIPTPDTLLFISWFDGGEVFRSGCCYIRGMGKIFYFRPGHEICGAYYIPEIQQVIKNAVRWAAPSNGPIPILGKARPFPRT
ncbi:MAG: trehalose utilization protein ThuA [Ruminiclostridium sp.]|nr:trehalose utilization protein ThuA [Ruminiclostridium sp.]